ncbi:MAG: hypothetical protein EBS36_02030 [Actinobacteria bacterium]|nr:hypothetical protein [Actinomycetota bacterium]
MSPNRGLGVLVVVILGIVLLAGSIPTSVVEPKQNSALVTIVGKVAEDGGNLVLGSSQLCDSFDPAESFDAWCAVVFRLYSRNVMSFSSKPGLAGFETQPDLAAATPRVHSSKAIWTFQIRKNAFWNSGKPVTVADIRYSIERLFSPEHIGAVNFNYLCLLSSCPKGVPSYQGPGMRGEKHLYSIRTTTKDTITFKLTSPNPNFDRVLALPQFSVVEMSRDLYLKRKKQAYRNLPSSSGPFVLKLDAKRQRAAFTRNKYWTQASDAIRAPHVKTIKWRVISDSKLLTKATLRNQIDVRIGEDFQFANADLAAASKKYGAQIDQPYTGFTSFLAVRSKSAPLNRISCRQAIFYAIDKEAIQRVKGGETKAQIATSLLPPLVAGYDASSDSYNSGSKPTGDLIAAEAALKKCGYPEGFEVSMAYLNIGIGTEIFRKVQSSLARVGIVLAPKKFDNYSKFVSVTRSDEQLTNEGIALVISGAQSMINSPLDYWSSFVDGRFTKPYDNENLAGLSDEQINAALDDIATGNKDARTLSGQINDQVMENATYLPITYDKFLLYRSPQIAGVYVQQALGGQYDIVNVGLVKTAKK